MDQEDEAKEIFILSLLSDMGFGAISIHTEQLQISDAP